MIHRPVTLTPSAQRRLADTQHAAGLSCTHALTSQRLDLLQLHNNLLRRVLRERPHGHPLCPATHGQDYSEQPSRNKRSENSDPSRCNTHLSGVTPLSDEPNHSQGLNHTRALHPLRGAAPLAWRCTSYVAVHPNRRGVMPTDRVHHHTNKPNRGYAHLPMGRHCTTGRVRTLLRVCLCGCGPGRSLLLGLA